MPYSSLADLVQAFENPSRDPAALNYRYDATHTASGLFQITDSTWGGFAGYPTAASAPAAVQYQKFGDLVAQRGLSDYTCPGCDPSLTAYVAAHPDVMNLPTFSGSSTASAPAAAPAAGSGGSFWQWLTAPPDPNTYNGANPNAYPDPNGIFGGASPAPAEGPGAAIVGGLNRVAGKGSMLDAATSYLASISTRVVIFILAVLFILGALFLFGLKSGIETETGGGN